MDISALWNSKERTDWENALLSYQTAVNKGNVEIEQKLNNMTTDDFKKMSGQDFYRFLVDDYALWKYTDGRIRSRVQSAVEEYHQMCGNSEFNKILDGIFLIAPDDIYLHLTNITRIKGIGVAGASGILSLVFPRYFGTVDRFAVENLQRVYSEDSFYGKKLHKIDPQNISTYDAAEVIRIYREKAEVLYEAFGIWTPRMVDMVLWSVREA